MMLRSTCISLPQGLPIPIPNPNLLPTRSVNLPSSSSSRFQTLSPKPIPNLRLHARNGDGDLAGEPDSEAEARKPNGSSSGEDDPKKDRRPVFNLRWGDLFSPDPDNFVAVGLTGLLTWASVQVLWQLFFISVAIIVAALKYSFIAALLLFILITLL